MKYEINKQLILEAFTGTQRADFDKTNSTLEKAVNSISGIPIVGSVPAAISQSVAGYNVGDKLGHPVAGTFLGRSGALGAASADPNSKLNVTDVYTRSNIINKLLQGGSTGAVAGGIIGGLPGAMVGGAIGGATLATISPAAQYGIGKVFSGKNTKYGANNER